MGRSVGPQLWTLHPDIRTIKSVRADRPIFLALAPVALGLAFLALPAGSAPSAGAAQPPVFRDATSQIGLSFVHDNGMSGRLYLPEITGSGLALFDLDNDGD